MLCYRYASAYVCAYILNFPRTCFYLHFIFVHPILYFQFSHLYVLVHTLYASQRFTVFPWNYSWGLFHIRIWRAPPGVFPNPPNPLNGFQACFHYGKFFFILASIFIAVKLVDQKMSSLYCNKHWELVLHPSAVAAAAASPTAPRHWQRSPGFLVLPSLFQ